MHHLLTASANILLVKNYTFYTLKFLINYSLVLFFDICEMLVVVPAKCVTKHLVFPWCPDTKHNTKYSLEKLTSLFKIQGLVWAYTQLLCGYYPHQLTSIIVLTSHELWINIFAHGSLIDVVVLTLLRIYAYGTELSLGCWDSNYSQRAQIYYLSDDTSLVIPCKVGRNDIHMPEM